MTTTRSRLRAFACTVLIIVGVLVVAVGPVIAQRAERRVEDLDRTGTSAVEELRRLNEQGTAASISRYEELAANDRALLVRIEDLSRRVDELLARLDARSATKTSSASVSTMEAVNVGSGDRWDALAACESTGDTDGVEPHRIDPDPDGYHLTAFQFSPDTAAKVGAYRGMPYAEQKAAAQRWAADPTIDASSTAGWPTCWPMVMGDTPT